MRCRYRGPARARRDGEIQGKVALNGSVIGRIGPEESIVAWVGAEIQLGQKVLNTMTALGQPVFEYIA